MSDSKLQARSWTLPLEAWTAQWSRWPADSVLMAERPEQVVLTFHKDAPSGDWDRGHLFTEAWHVQWRRLGARVRAVVLGEPPDLDAWGAPGVPPLDLSDAEAETRQVVLWGHKRAGEDFWMELRIPHVMRAPELHPPGHDEHLTVEHARRLLTLTTYRSAKDGRVLMHRYTGLSYAQTDGQGKRLTPIDDVP